MIQETSNPYTPSKMHIVCARGNGKSSLGVKLTTAIIRANVYQYFDPLRDEIHFISKSSLAPLTDEEKELITATLGIHMCPYKVVFDN